MRVAAWSAGCVRAFSLPGVSHPHSTPTQVKTHFPANPRRTYLITSVPNCPSPIAQLRIRLLCTHAHFPSALPNTYRHIRNNFCHPHRPLPGLDRAQPTHMHDDFHIIMKICLLEMHISGKFHLSFSYLPTLRKSARFTPSVNGWRRHGSYRSRHARQHVRPCPVWCASSSRNDPGVGRRSTKARA